MTEEKNAVVRQNFAAKPIPGGSKHSSERVKIWLFWRNKLDLEAVERLFTLYFCLLFLKYKDKGIILI